MSASVPGQTSYLAKAELHNKFGCLDTTGKEVIPLKYDDMGFWGDGLIPVNIGAGKVDYMLAGGKWGYCDTKGKLVIPTKYSKAEKFHDGLAAVQHSGKWGFINTAGVMVIKPIYSKVRSFHYGLCAVYDKGKWGYINKTGGFAIQPIFALADDFDGDRAAGYLGKIPHDIREEPTGGFCLIDRTGRQLTAPVYKYIWSFCNGFAKVDLPDSTNQYHSRKGFIDRNGKVIVPVIYDEVQDFKEGMAMVATKIKDTSLNSSEENYKCGYVDTTGRVVIPLQFCNAGQFINGNAVVSKGVQRGMEYVVTDSVTDTVINSSFWPHFALIDRSGRYILDYDWRMLVPVEGGLFIAERKRYLGAGLINSTGKNIIPYRYMNLHSAGGGVFVAPGGLDASDTTTVIDSNNRVLFISNKYQMPVARYRFGLLDVRSNKLSKSGLVNLKGELVIKDKYDMIWDFEPTSGRD